MILGTGIDLVEVERIRHQLERHGERFVARIFTESEAAYCRLQADPAIHFAARFAAKEAASKALGTGLAEGVGWQDVEVLRQANGAPSLAMHGGALARGQRLGVQRSHLSISHSKHHAIAQVILEGGWGEC